MDAVEIEASQYIPVPTEALYLDYQIIERTKDEITVLMCAANQDFIDKITSMTIAAGLEPVMIEPSINASARLLNLTESGQLTSIIVDIGPLLTDIAILDKGFVRISGSIPIGGNTFTLDIAKSLKISLEEAHQLKVINGLSAGLRQQKIQQALNINLERIISEIKKIIRYYTERIDSNKKMEQLLILGSGSSIPGLGDYFTNRLIMPARVASPWQQLDFAKLSQPSRQQRSNYITVAGLACIDPREIWL
jgi:type IV pilus assembly protein PilM